jgi:hypothetical protein
LDKRGSPCRFVCERFYNVSRKTQIAALKFFLKFLFFSFLQDAQRAKNEAKGKKQATEN